MSDSSAQDWINDLTEPSDDDDDSPSLFEENFRQMIEDEDLEGMAVSTLENQVERIDDPAILADAMDVDDRDAAQDVYQSRVGDINAESVLDETEDTEEADEADEPEEPAEGADDEDTADGVSDVVDEVVDGGDSDDEDADQDEVKKEGDEPSSAPSEGDSNSEADPNPSEPNETSHDASHTQESDASDLPTVDVASLAPDAISRAAAVEQDKQRTLLVWGPEGSGKSHIAHSAPAPICYIDTEGKADELAEKFDKRIHYFVADDYKEAKAAMEQALDVLDEYLDNGVRGTLVVDSMTAMWEYAKVDYAKFAYQTENLSEVNFQSELEGEKDWTKIKARHNEEFRETILESPYHVVFTSGQKEEYGAVFNDGGKKWVPDGEKWNRYAVKDAVRLRRDDAGKTVADLRKAAKTRYSFAGLEWPTFGKVYDAIDEICSAEQAEQEIDVTDWPFSVIDGQPVGNSPGPSDDGDDEGEGDGD